MIHKKHYTYEKQMRSKRYATHIHEASIKTNAYTMFSIIMMNA